MDKTWFKEQRKRSEIKGQKMFTSREIMTVTQQELITLFCSIGRPVVENRGREEKKDLDRE